MRRGRMAGMPSKKIDAAFQTLALGLIVAALAVYGALILMGRL
jgi:hypothetical protein